MLGLGDSNWLCVLTPLTLQHTPNKGKLCERSLVIFTTLELTLDCICVLSVKSEYLVELLLLRESSVFLQWQSSMPLFAHANCEPAAVAEVCLGEPCCSVKAMSRAVKGGWFLCTSLMVIISPSVASHGVGDFIQTQQLDLICQSANKNSVG